MDAVLSATVETPVAAGPEPESPAAPIRPGLDAGVLSGRFAGRDDPALASDLVAFLSGDDVGRLLLWFGRDRMRTWPTDDREAFRDVLRGAVDRDIAAIDTLLSEQVDEILHHPRLRKLEGSWRGLDWLVHKVDQGAKLKIKAMSVGWAEICRDLERALDFDQSHMFRKIYEDEFGTPGGEPFGMMVIDHEMTHRPSATSRTDDVTALGQLCGVAAAAFCPMVLGVAPAMLETERFGDLASVTELTRPFTDLEHARWRTLSARPDMRFIGLALPRILARPPWEADGTRADKFIYAEYAPTADQRVWMSAGYAFAMVAARSFAQFAWPADVRGVEAGQRVGGLVDGLPIEPFRTDPDHTWVRAPIEIVWTDRQERELVDVGMMPLSAIPHSEELVFGSVRSLLAPQRYGGQNAAAADANARLSSQLNSILCASRFAHCLKMIGRQMVGSFRTADEIQRELTKWLLNYVSGSTANAIGESRARKPLVDGKVQVAEVAAKPGSFSCVVHLQPLYQLDDVSATFQLVTDLGRR